MDDAIKKILNCSDINDLYKDECDTTFLGKLIILSNKNQKLCNIIKDYCIKNPSKLYNVQHQWSALILATVYNNLNVVKVLCDIGVDVNYHNGPNNFPALLHAAERGHYDIVKVLCDNGANINYNYKNYCPLYFAVDNNHGDIVKILCNKGADINTIRIIPDWCSYQIAETLFEHDFVKPPGKYLNILNKVTQLNLKN